MMPGFDPMLLLVLNLAGTFAFGLSGGVAGVRPRLDLFGVVVLAVVVGLARGPHPRPADRRPPTTIRDWRYLAGAAGAGFVTLFAHPLLRRIGGPIDVLDAAGLALLCVTGASTALDHGLAAAPAVILGAITGIGGGILRDILVRQIPVVLQEGLYAIPALIGAAIIVGAARAGVHGPAAPIIGAAVCFVIRLAGLKLGLNIPAPGA
jgi:uncharacterized membrane protein YeiH